MLEGRFEDASAFAKETPAVREQRLGTESMELPFILTGIRMVDTVSKTSVAHWKLEPESGANSAR